MNMRPVIFLGVIILFGLKSYAQMVGPWDTTALRKAPSWRETDLAPADGMISILYESLDFLGNTVEVFAYYSAPAGEMPTGGWPAVVYAHGGGCTAIPAWVKFWNNHGYAAISMDLEGRYPGTDALGNKNVSPNPGPSRSDIFDDYDKPMDEQWYYHAIAQLILANSLIASFPEVNANQVGITGTSWGGNVTSTVMGVDDRWAWGIPVYGAGFLSESDGDQGRGLQVSDKADFVNAHFDGSAYFNNVTFPTMWVNGTNDYSFALTCNQKSSRAVNGPTTLLYSLRFAHNNNAARKLDQMYLFANSVIKGETPLIALEKSVQVGNQVSVEYASDLSVTSAQLLYTFDDDLIWPDKYWFDTTAIVTNGSIIATIPEGATAVILTATDSRGAMVTTEYMEITNEEVNATNLAPFGTASQSSTAFEGDASLAIDQKTNGAYADRSVTHTGEGNDEWWMVTLDSTYELTSITVYNRTDTRHIDRLSDFTIEVLDSNDQIIFTETITSAPNPSVTISIDDYVVGNSVRIVQNLASTALNLAEVEVVGYSLTDEIITELNDEANNTQTYVFPNPTNDQISVELGNTEYANYQVLNSTGQLLLSGEISDGSTSVDVSQLTSGVYGLRITSEVVTQTTKIIKK